MANNIKIEVSRYKTACLAVVVLIVATTAMSCSTRGGEQAVNAIETAKDVEAIAEPKTKVDPYIGLEFEASRNQITDDAYIVASIQNMIAKQYFMTGEPKDIQVALTPDQQCTWAIVNPNTATTDGQHDLELYRLEETKTPLEPIFTANVSPPLSAGLAVGITSYEGKYLIFGAVSNAHWSGDTDTRTDLSSRSYLTIYGEKDKATIQLDGDNDAALFVSIFESKPVDITIHDETGNVLLKLSDTEIELAEVSAS